MKLLLDKKTKIDPNSENTLLTRDWETNLKMAISIGMDYPTSRRRKPNDHEGQIDKREWPIRFIDSLSGLHFPGDNSKIVQRWLEYSLNSHSLCIYNASSTTSARSRLCIYYSETWILLVPPSYPFFLNHFPTKITRGNYLFNISCIY